MSTYTTPKTTARTIFRRVAAGAALAVAPALIALGTAAAGHADTGSTSGDNPSVSVPTAPVVQRNQDIVRGYLPHTSLSHHMKRDYQY